MRPHSLLESKVLRLTGSGGAADRSAERTQCRRLLPAADVASAPSAAGRLAATRRARTHRLALVVRCIASLGTAQAARGGPLSRPLGVSVDRTTVTAAPPAVSPTSTDRPDAFSAPLSRRSSPLPLALASTRLSALSTSRPHPHSDAHPARPVASRLPRPVPPAPGALPHAALLVPPFADRPTHAARTDGRRAAERV